MLTAIGFRVVGWSRGPRELPGIETWSGAEGLSEVLGASEILVLLLPATPATENTLDARALAMLPRGARIINPGRGPLIDDEALLKALDNGHVGHATLDVFRQEPLPAEHPYWAHPMVTVTPHIASATRPETASMAIAENVRRGEAGLDFLNVVNRAESY
jgi:glyoxylate/hydroxypyruvate reductase A